MKHCAGHVTHCAAGADCASVVRTEKRFGEQVGAPKKVALEEG